jgi:tetratricopeptide (TPR) repeat protein
VVDLSGNGTAAVVPWPEGEAQGSATSPFAVAWPLTDAELADLRWYFEDYLRAPFAVYENRGQRVAEALPRWGRTLFDALFGAGPGRDAYIAVRSSINTGGIEILIRSADPQWLGLPWELLQDPHMPVPLALEEIFLSRGLPATDLDRSLAVGGERLRILTVISRPSGKADVGYRMIARAVSEHATTAAGPVDLVVLRPPTLEALRAALEAARAAGTPFQVVHFDGHGSFLPSGEGALVFERPSGGSHAVPAGRVAQVLAGADVPVVILNACQSGAIGKKLAAGVATCLLDGGCAAVLAMAYSVYAVAAAEFMTAFYEQLFAGDTLDSAVRAGRIRMSRNSHRPSPKGPLPLHDWAIPVLYRRCEVRFPLLATAHIRLTGNSAGTAGPARDDSLPDPLTPADTFIGRDSYFYALEAAAHTHRVIVLHGPAGTGKTELAKAFGRWWRDTGALDRPDGVIWYSLEPGSASSTMDSLVAAIGMPLAGPGFAELDAARRRERVGELLHAQRVLLILDNFETIASMPGSNGGIPQPSPQDRAGIDDFLTRIAGGGRSVVLITSRNPESWLSGEIDRILVGGLSGEEAHLYCEHLLAHSSTAALRRGQPAFAELESWLDGNPLAMRLVLPELDHREPEPLLDELRATAVPSGDRGTAGGCTAALAASIGYSITHLPDVDRQLLEMVALLHGTVDAEVLAHLSLRDDVPPRFRGVGRTRWDALLDHAVAVGLLTRLSGPLYRIHPALPAELAAAWRAGDPRSYHTDRATTEVALTQAYHDFANYLRQQMTAGDAATAHHRVHLQLRNFQHFLGYALDHGLWHAAQVIFSCLSSYWENLGISEEFDAWFDRARRTLADAVRSSEPLDDPGHALYLFIVSSHAHRLVIAGRLDEAEAAYSELRSVIDSRPDDGHLAAIDYQLGRIAQERGDLDEAAVRFLRSLEVEERLGNRVHVARSSHQLGNIAMRRHEFDAAEQRYRRSLAIFEDLGNQDGIAGSHYQLAAVAQQVGDLVRAQAHYLRSLALVSRLGNRPQLGRIYHALGVIADIRRDDAAAEHWCRESLIVKEQMGDEPGLAVTYALLAVIMHRRGSYDTSDELCLRSLAICERIGDLRGVADACHQLGINAVMRGDASAETWLRRSLALEEPLGVKPRLAEVYGMLSLCGDTETRLEWAVRSLHLLDGLQDHPDTGDRRQLMVQHLRELTNTVGRQSLERTWRRVTGMPLPVDLR